MSVDVTKRQGRVRPRRADELALAASRLFGRRGYPNVSLRQISEAVGLTAPAVYRYYPDKQTLLAAALDMGLDAIVEVIEAPRRAPLDALLDLSRTALQHEGLWQLMRRETRYLNPEQRAAVLTRFRGILKGTYALVAAHDPRATRSEVEWRARSVYAVLAAPSQYPQELSQRDQLQVLRRLVAAVVEPAPPGGADRMIPVDKRSLMQPSTRQEEILACATSLFAQRGYQDVSMNDIGAAAGMAGPSIYHYFVSKGEILEAIFRRGINWIEFDQMRAARDEADALEVLERTLSYYAAMGLDHHELFSIYVVDSVHLDHRGHASVIKSYARMIDHWVALMARARPELPAGEARLLVTAALCEVNELTEVPRLTHAEGGRSRLLQATRVIISA